jgi:hypothetical protein
VAARARAELPDAAPATGAERPPLQLRRVKGTP